MKSGFIPSVIMLIVIEMCVYVLNVIILLGWVPSGVVSLGIVSLGWESRLSIFAKVSDFLLQTIKVKARAGCLYAKWHNVIGMNVVKISVIRLSVFAKTIHYLIQRIQIIKVITHRGERCTCLFSLQFFTADAHKFGKSHWLANFIT
jgi:hypothetical protein